MTDPDPSSEFDAWAPQYDQSISDQTGFPFDGYSALLKTIFDLCAPQPGAAVLDLGIGTGNLAQLFESKGCEIWGLDFSIEMLALAQLKLPKATLSRVDLRSTWPPDFQRHFDCIVSAYTFHHFTLDEKVDLVKRLLMENLAPGGRLVIGDIAFQDAGEEDRLRRSLGTQWEQEYYWLADETAVSFKVAGIDALFIKISSCAGVFQFSLERQ